MTRLDARSKSKPLYLNEEEAMALLDICVFMETDNDPSRLEAMRKVAGLCREFIRDEAAGDFYGVGSRRPGFQEALARLTRRREAAKAYAG